MNNDEVSQLLEEHKGLITKCVKEFHKVGMLTKQDYIQIAKIAFVKALPKWDAKKSKFSTYMYNCMRNAIISQFTNYKTQKFINISSRNLVCNQDKESIFDYIPDNLLSNKEKEIINLYIQGYSLREISKELQESITKVKILFTGIINKLKQYNEEN